MMETTRDPHVIDKSPWRSECILARITDNSRRAGDDAGVHLLDDVVDFHPVKEHAPQAGSQHGLIREHIAGQPAPLLLEIDPHDIQQSTNCRTCKSLLSG